ncbi:MAG: DedA family protein [Patescibacteria group bacterium]
MEIVSTNAVLNLLYQHRYIFSFLGALFEGTFIMLLAGVLYKFGYFNFWGLFAVLLAGYFLNGVGWYLLGRFGGNAIMEKWVKRFRVGRKIVDKLEDYFKEHSIKTLFITRVTYGLSMYTFIIAGTLKMAWKKFLSVNLVASVGWVAIMVGLGYGFGASYRALSIVTKSIAFGVAVVIFLAIVLVSISFVYLLRYFARQKFVQEMEKHNHPFIRRIGEVITKIFNNKK